MTPNSWSKPEAPAVKQWRDRVKNVSFLEQITAKLQLKMEAFMGR